MEIVSTHSRPKAAGHFITDGKGRLIVSTHSRPKAAGWFLMMRQMQMCRFNSQPPEGGWPRGYIIRSIYKRFQLTAARRRLVLHHIANLLILKFQLTAARRRLAVKTRCHGVARGFQLTAARRRLVHFRFRSHIVIVVSTHSRPKAAGRFFAIRRLGI